MENPQAFPRPLSKIETFDGNECSGDQDGMTLLDYFAGQVIQQVYRDNPIHSQKEVACQAYDIAEAMLKEREERMK